MKRKSIGSVEIDTSLAFWTNGKNANQLRQNERELFSIIDLLQSKALFANENELENLFSEMDKAYVALQLINSFAQNETLLYNAGIVLNDAILKGDFDLDFDSLEERNNYINQLSDDLISKTNSNTLSNFLDPDFAQWWDEIIVKENYYVDVTTGEKTAQIQESSVISGSTDEFCSKLKKSGMSLLYVYADPSILTTKKAMSKYYDQRDITNSLKVVNPSFSNSVCENLITSGIIEDTKGLSVNEAVENLKQNGKSKIGELIAIITLIVTAVVALCGMVSSIFAARKAETDKKTAEILKDSNIQNAAASEYDFPASADLNNDGVISEDEKNIYVEKKQKNTLIYGGIALALLWLLTSN